jgi:hypothetical protein
MRQVDEEDGGVMPVMEVTVVPAKDILGPFDLAIWKSNPMDL